MRRREPRSFVDTPGVPPARNRRATGQSVVSGVQFKGKLPNLSLRSSGMVFSSIAGKYRLSIPKESMEFSCDAFQFSNGGPHKRITRKQ